VSVEVRPNLHRLIQEEDTDGDKRITVDDACVRDTERGDKRFLLHATDGTQYEISGTYLSNLLQELKLAEDSGLQVAELRTHSLFEGPVERISRSIREIYWDGLTRRIDRESLAAILLDEKVTTRGYRYLYVPRSDQRAYQYFLNFTDARPDLRIRVVPLPDKVTANAVRDLDGKHGLLVLALRVNDAGDYEGVPFVVPGGRFNEMYGWDSYFEALGLLVDGRVDLAKSMVDNFVYQIQHYGKILNANRTYYLTRSQPPFLTSMARAVYDQLPQEPETKKWLEGVLWAAVKEYQNVWHDSSRITETGLNRYFGAGHGPPPEVEVGHFDPIYQAYAEGMGIHWTELKRLYEGGRLNPIRWPGLKRNLDAFFVHDRCVRESGHDTTYRWNWDGDRCADFVTVDLNSLLYKIEIDIARVIEGEFGGTLTGSGAVVEKSQEWYERALRRKELITEYLWDDKRGVFFDYDVKKHKRRYEYYSATSFYPLWANLATPLQAERVVKSALPLLEMPGGVAASAEASREQIPHEADRQWDYPNGWAPHQMLIWRGLLNYGYTDIAHRLIYRWLYTITRNAVDYNGTVPEKFDVVKRSHRVFTEYGNVGTKFAYITKEGFGWMNASYQVGLQLLPADLRRHLDHLVPPEWLFGARLSPAKDDPDQANAQRK
jgi:alpha,alpha-trehalase